jgi:uncharacterized protein YkwD
LAPRSCNLSCLFRLNRRFLILPLLLLALALPAGLAACFSIPPASEVVTESLAVTESSDGTTVAATTRAATTAATDTSTLATSAATSAPMTQPTSITPPATTATTRATTHAATTATTRATTHATTATATETTAGSLSEAGWIAAIFAATNAARIANDVAPLSPANADLTLAAAIRADEINQLFEHKRPDGRDFFTVLAECGVAYSTAGENIAYATTGYFDPQKLVDAWMDSTGHRANILNSSFTSLGIGYARSGGQEYFVQLFVG